MLTGKSHAPAPRKGDGLNSIPAKFDRTAGAAWQLYVLLAAIALFHALTLREGQAWADDFALYLMHARNLVEGRAYADTGYIYNAADPFHSPRAYPPGFPLLIAPIYAWFGLNLFALRLVVIASLVGSVAAFVALVRPVLPPRFVLATAALVGFQPYFIRFKNLLLPDFSFMLVVFVSLHLLRRLHESRARTKDDLGWAVLAGACMAISLSFRTIGVALFGALVLYHIFRRTLPSAAVLISIATVALCYGAVYVLMPRTSGYIAQITDAAPQLLRELALLIRVQRLVDLFKYTDIMWEGTTWAVTVVLMFVGAGLAVIGYVIRLRRLSVIETFVIAYVAVLIIFPFGAARYLLPVIPLIIMYGTVGFSFLTSRGNAPVRAGALAVVILVAVVYLANVVFVERGPYVTGVTGTNATEAFAYVRRCTPPDAMIASRRPRAIALFTRRSAISPGLPQLNNNDTYSSFLESAAVDYVVTFRNTVMHQATVALTGMLSLVFQNDQFLVYRNEARPSRTTQPPLAGCSPL